MLEGDFAVGLVASELHGWHGETAYHYTNQAGLLGILESGVIHAGSTRYLNDPTEGAVGRECWRAAVGSDAHLSAALDVEHELRGLETFVASFSLESDLLSQWRGYADGGRGFALGFDCQAIGLQTTSRGIVLYDPSQQHRVMEMAVRELRSLAGQAELDRAELSRTAAHIRLLCETFFKDEAYREEREFRLIHVSRREGTVQGDVVEHDEGVNQSLAFRPTPRGPAPYVSLHLQLLPGCLKEVVVGPQLDFEDTRTTLKMLLDRAGCQGVEVLPSGVPHRT